jgi:hypothetical protein
MATNAPAALASACHDVMAVLRLLASRPAVVIFSWPPAAA